MIKSITLRLLAAVLALRAIGATPLLSTRTTTPPCTRCSTTVYNDVNFDKLPEAPVGGVVNSPPPTPYMGLKYTGADVATQSPVEALRGVKVHTPNNSLGAVAGKGKTPIGATVDGTDTSSFDLRSFWVSPRQPCTQTNPLIDYPCQYGCKLATMQSNGNPANKCTVTVTGTKKDNSVVVSPSRSVAARAKFLAGRR